MDLRLTPDQLALREEARVFSEGSRPLLEADQEWRRQGLLSDGDSRAVTEELGRAGWIGLPWPTELGGRDLGHLDAALAEEVFGYHWLPLSLYLLSSKTIGAALERFASSGLKEQLLPPIARGELVFCQGFSEPSAGSDLGSLRTRAVLDGERFVVDGHKIWTSSAHLADWIYLAVRTDSERPKHHGISVLVADLGTPGITVRQFPTLGGGSLCEVFLEAVEIPHTQLVGELHGGWEVLMHTLDYERITAEKLGGVAWVLDGVERHLEEQGHHRAAWEQIAGLRGELDAARLLSFRAAWLLDRNEPAAAASAMAKLGGARVTQRVADAACDLLGLDGLIDGDPTSPVDGRVGALYRAAVGSTISGGTAEVLQLVIARRGLDRRLEP